MILQYCFHAQQNVFKSQSVKQNVLIMLIQIHVCFLCIALSSCITYTTIASPHQKKYSNQFSHLESGNVCLAKALIPVTVVLYNPLMPLPKPLSLKCSLHDYDLSNFDSHNYWKLKALELVCIRPMPSPRPNLCCMG